MLRVYIGLLLLSLCGHSFALMAGSAAGQPSDTPARRIDANLPNSPWVGVGSLRTPNGSYSATVVARDYVLTAAHVVAGVAAADLRFALNADGDLSFGSIAAAVIVHPGFVSPQQPNANDLALVRLAQPIPDGVEPYLLSSRYPRLGAEIVLVGYGASGDGAVGPNVSGSSTRKRVGRNVIDSFGHAPAGQAKSALVFYDFDGPRGTANPLGGPTLGNDVETIVASGDSGGPCFVFERGQWKLTAISTFVITTTSARASTFGSIGGAVLLQPHREWLAASMHAPAPHSNSQSGYAARFLRYLQSSLSLVRLKPASALRNLLYALRPTT